MQDPFACGGLFITDSAAGFACRSNCDMHHQNAKVSQLAFHHSLEQALATGAKPCAYTLPDYVQDFKDLDGTYVSVDIGLLVETVQHVNNDVGFAPTEEPITPPDSLAVPVNSASSQSCTRAKASFIEDPLVRTMPLAPNKSDNERLRLVDMAYRHLALAAMSSISDVALVAEPVGNLGALNCGPSRAHFSLQDHSAKRKRGGVMGFKELASKCGMSPWHFHRVFKALTNVTPKLYGDKCIAYIRHNESRFLKSFYEGRSIILSAVIVGASEDHTVVKRVQHTFDVENERVGSDGSTASLSGSNSYKRRHVPLAHERRNTIDTIGTMGTTDSFLSAVPMRSTQSSSSTMNTFTGRMGENEPLGLRMFGFDQQAGSMEMNLPGSLSIASIASPNGYPIHAFDHLSSLDVDTLDTLDTHDPLAPVNPFEVDIAQLSLDSAQMLLSTSSNTPLTTPSVFKENFKFSSDMLPSEPQNSIYPGLQPLNSTTPAEYCGTDRQTGAPTPVNAIPLPELNQQFLLKQLRRQNELADAYTKRTVDDEFMVDKLINWD